MAHAALQIVTTTEQKEEAVRIARALVERRLAACVQIVGPVTSIYRWRGTIEEAQEWQCWAKCQADDYGEVESAITALHPYDEPEVLATPVVAGSGSYLKWLMEETTRSA